MGMEYETGGTKIEKEFNDIWKWIIDKHRRTRGSHMKN